MLLMICSTCSLLGQTWTQISVPSNKKLNCISFSGNQTGYIGGADSTLLKSTDGGHTWQLLNPVGLTFFPGGGNIQKMKFINDSTGFITVGPYGGAYKTVDGGNTWTALSLSNGLCFNDGLYFFDENTGFIGGTGCFQGEMIDKITAGIAGAAQLNHPSFDNSSLITDIDFYDNNLGLASAKGGRIYRTTDGGNTWDSVSVYGFSMNSVAFINDTLCYAGYTYNNGGFGILISENGGLTWAEDFSSATFFYPNYYGIHVDINDKVFVGAYSQGSNTGLIFEKETSGIWNYNSVDQAIYSFASIHDSIVFAVGDSGYVVVNHALPTGIKEEQKEIHAFEFYPNPTFDEVILNGSHSFSGELQIRIYNLNGMLVKEINSGINFPYSLSTGELPRGVYQMNILRENQVMQRSRLIKL